MPQGTVVVHVVGCPRAEYRNVKSTGIKIRIVAWSPPEERMVISYEPLWGDAVEDVDQEYEDAIVYGDRASETVPHDGALRILANGWVKLPTDRLLSPEAVPHNDTR